MPEVKKSEINKKSELEIFRELIEGEDEKLSQIISLNIDDHLLKQEISHFIPKLYGNLWKSFKDVRTKPPRGARLEEQFLSLSSEVQDLKNKLNKYFKLELREEATSQFAGLISTIKNIKEVYVNNEANQLTFWIFYDYGDRIELIEEIVDIECHFERLFPKLKFDYRILPYSSMNYHIASQTDLIYQRG